MFPGQNLLVAVSVVGPSRRNFLPNVQLVDRGKPSASRLKLSKISIVEGGADEEEYEGEG